MARTLTPKQTAYRDARVSGLGPADAYRTAYDASRMSPAAVYAEANKLENHPQIAPSITQSLSEAVQVVEAKRQEAVASAAWIIEKAIQVIEIGMATVPVRGRDGKVIENHYTDEDGNETAEPAFYEAHNLAAVNGALKLLALRHPEFSAKHEHSGPGGGPIPLAVLQVLAQMQPEQIHALAGDR